MTTVQLRLPAPPEAVWNALPAGVAALRGSAPVYDRPRGTLSFKTGMTLFTWGQKVTVLVSPAEGGGSVLTITTNLKVGLVGWGEGNRLSRRFADAVASAVGTTALA
jgi:hypothetical protein